jgi:hypothetical protein
MTAVVLVGCSVAGADPGAPASSSASAPPGWKQLPAIATAAGAAAKADGVVIDAVDAWGEPALGCYAVWLALHGQAQTAPILADQVLDGFTAAFGPRKAPESARHPKQTGSPWQLSLDEVVKPSSPDGVLAFAFAIPPYRGRVRAHLGSGRIAAIACFGNQREPAACEAACTRILQGLP